MRVTRQCSELTRIELTYSAAVCSKAARSESAGRASAADGRSGASPADRRCLRTGSDIAPIGLKVRLVLLARLPRHARHAEAAGPCGGCREDGSAAADGLADDSNTRSAVLFSHLPA